MEICLEYRQSSASMVKTNSGMSEDSRVRAIKIGLEPRPDPSYRKQDAGALSQAAN